MTIKSVNKGKKKEGTKGKKSTPNAICILESTLISPKSIPEPSVFFAQSKLVIVVVEKEKKESIHIIHPLYHSSP